MEEDQAYQFRYKDFNLFQKKILESRENPYQTLLIPLESIQLYYLYSRYYFKGCQKKVMNFNFISKFLSFFILQFMIL